MIESSQSSQMRNDENQNKRSSVKHSKHVERSHTEELAVRMEETWEALDENLQDTTIFGVKSMFSCRFSIEDMPHNGLQLRGSSS